MSIHKEGYSILLGTGVFLIISNAAGMLFLEKQLMWISYGVSLLIFITFLQFFRSPDRIIPQAENAILSPADGNIVVIEKTLEKEYFNDERIQVSIFMSPLNVHLNRVPFNGHIIYQKHHPGNYLVAWHPKSSLLNERNTLVLETNTNEQVLLRQIAGFVARRIRCYKKVNQPVLQGDELGFIKFGSRVDLFLPPDCKLNVELDQNVKGGQSVIAYFS